MTSQRAATLIAELREIPALTPEWHGKCEEIEQALGLVAPSSTQQNPDSSPPAEVRSGE